jgi:lipoate-protein ligase B
VTLGRSAREENLRTPRAALVARGVEVHEVARGGDVTWHGPGQLVGYAILDLAARGRADVHRFLRDLEAGLVDALAALDVPAEAIPGMTGVFVAGAAKAAKPPRNEAQPSEVKMDVPRKLASIGVGLRGWITWHGFALNVESDLHGFEAIVPCGLRGVEMTSVARELGAAAPADLWERARAAVAEAVPARLA